MFSLLERLDQAVYRLERFVVGAGLFAMSAMVFVDVVHRTFADPESRLARWMAAGLEAMGDAGSGDRIYPALRDWVAPPLLFTFFVILAYVAVRWRAGGVHLSRLRAWGTALAITTLAALVVRLLIWTMPNGVVWAQTLALVLTLWVGFAGASMCTRDGRHLRVEVADRLWPASMRRIVGTLAPAFTAVVVLSLFLLSLDFVSARWDDYVQSDGYGGIVEGFPALPQWLAFAILPISFLVMGLRFLAAAVATALGGSYGRGVGDPIAAMIDEAGEGGGAGTPADPGASEVES